MRDRTWRCGIIVLISSVWCAMISVWAAPPDAEFLAARQSFLRDMKKKSPEVRAAAVKTFAEFIEPNTAELLLKHAFNDDDPSVKHAGQIALRQLAEATPVRQFLSDELKKGYRKPVITPGTIELFRALALTADEQTRADFLKNLDDFLSSPKGNALVPITVIDEMAKQGDTEAFRVVNLLSGSKAFEIFGYRRAVVQAMTAIREPAAVQFLIDQLPQSKGLIQHDVVDYLTRLTKQKFKDNDRNWANWWKDNQATFQFPPAGAELPPAPPDDKQLTYYGIPIGAKRVVFVLDTSGSMRGLPIDQAKQALLKAIEGLPEAVAFNIVTFDAQAVTWHPRLVPATVEAKQDAAQTIMQRSLRIGTASHAALEAAFRLEPEAIYFLSDGEPTDGPPQQIVSSVTQQNRTRRISIHTIGVVTDRNGGAGLTLFMRPLATQNFGTFQLVQ